MENQELKEEIRMQKAVIKILLDKIDELKQPMVTAYISNKDMNTTKERKAFLNKVNKL